VRFCGSFLDTEDILAFYYAGSMLLNIVRSCIGTKFTSRFGTLIAVSLRNLGYMKSYISLVKDMSIRVLMSSLVLL
jgi:hypothetical protein